MGGAQRKACPGHGRVRAPVKVIHELLVSGFFSASFFFLGGGGGRRGGEEVGGGGVSSTCSLCKKDTEAGLGHSAATASLIFTRYTHTPIRCRSNEFA